MILFISLHTVFFCGFLFVSVNSLLMNPGNRLNRLFSLVALVVALIYLVGILNQTAEDRETAHAWVLAGTVLFTLFLYLILIFFLLFTNLFRVRWFHYLVLSVLPAITLIFEFIAPQLVNLIRQDGLWCYKEITAKGEFLFHTIYLLLYPLLCVIVIIIWYKKTESLRKRRLAVILVLTLIISEVLTIGDHFILFHVLKIFPYRIPGFFMPYFIVWILGIWYVIRKYRFLTITPETVSRDIIEGSSDCILLLDNDMNIVMSNNRVQEVTGKSEKQLKGLPAAGLFTEKHELVKKLNPLIRGSKSEFAGKYHLQSPAGDMLVDCKFSISKDKFSELLGILAVVREVKGMDRLKTIYGVSDREIEIIRHTLTGSTNKQIAEILGITERTVKAHLTSVYNKMGIDNKAQLLNLVLEG